MNLFVKNDALFSASRVPLVSLREIDHNFLTKDSRPPAKNKTFLSDEGLLFRASLNSANHPKLQGILNGSWFTMAAKIRCILQIEFDCRKMKR